MRAKKYVFLIIPLQIRSAMQCMHDRKNVGKVLLSPLKAPPEPEPKEQPKKVEEPAKEEEKAEEKVSGRIGTKLN